MLIIYLHTHTSKKNYLALSHYSPNFNHMSFPPSDLQYIICKKMCLFVCLFIDLSFHKFITNLNAKLPNARFQATEKTLVLRLGA